MTLRAARVERVLDQSAAQQQPRTAAMRGVFRWVAGQVFRLRCSYMGPRCFDKTPTFGVSDTAGGGALTHCSCEAPIVGVHQIKLPVSDLAISSRWYADLFDLELANEFFEDAAVRGVVLADHEARFVIGLR